MLDGLRIVRGVVRSLWIYYGQRQRHRAMDRLHGEFVRPGSLVFDIGSHVGDRVASFRRLGCRVVALEPQPALVRVLRLLYGAAPDVAIRRSRLHRMPSLRRPRARRVGPRKRGRARTASPSPRSMR
jgi:hypothetical protein